MDRPLPLVRRRVNDFDAEGGRVGVVELVNDQFRESAGDLVERLVNGNRPPFQRPEFAEPNAGRFILMFFEARDFGRPEVERGFLLGQN